MGAALVHWLAFRRYVREASSARCLYETVEPLGGGVGLPLAVLWSACASADSALREAAVRELPRRHASGRQPSRPEDSCEELRRTRANRASVIKTLASGGVVSLVCFRAARSRNCSLSAIEILV